MTIKTDPDDLSQGAVKNCTGVTFTVPSPEDRTVTMTATATLPVLLSGEFFEVRDHVNDANNGLYVEVGGSPTTSNVVALKLTGLDPASAASATINTYGNSSGSPQSSTQKSIHFATDDRDVYVLEQGNIDADGATLQCIYSFAKEEWKNDNFLFVFPFPFVAITPEQYEMVENWNFNDTVDATTSPQITVRSRKLVRTGGWSELDGAGFLQEQYMCAISLGTFVEATDRAYYALGNDPTDTAAAIDFEFDGPVNESVKVYDRVFKNIPFQGGGLDFGTNTLTRNDGGNWINDGVRVGGQVTIEQADVTANNGTYTVQSLTSTVITLTTSFPSPPSPEGDNNATVAADNRNLVSLFLREGFSTALDPDSGKTFAQANLADIGVTGVSNQAYRFPLANAADLKITNNDTTVSTRSPTVTISYFATPQIISGFNADAGSTQSPQTDGAFGVVIDAKGLVLEQVYEYVQYRLRQASNINDNTASPGGGAVTGKTADELLEFVGDSLGSLAATNPSGGGTGVTVINFNSADTNRLSFVDNDGLTRTFPFVAAGNISFNDNLQNDSGPARFTMYYNYTEQVTGQFTIAYTVGTPNATLTANDSPSPLPAGVSVGDFIALGGFAEDSNNQVFRVTSTASYPQSVDLQRYDRTLVEANESLVSNVTFAVNPIDSPDAIIVDSAGAFSPLPITGIVAAASASFDFDYDGNTQGGRTAGTDASVTVRAIGTDTAQPVEASGTIARTTTNNFTLVAPLERNFDNP